MHCPHSIAQNYSEEWLFQRVCPLHLAVGWSEPVDIARCFLWCFLSVKVYFLLGFVLCFLLSSWRGESLHRYQIAVWLIGRLVQMAFFGPDLL